MARNPNWPKVPSPKKKHRPTAEQLKKAREELQIQENFKQIHTISVEEAQEVTVCEVIRQIWRLSTRELSQNNAKAIQKLCETAMAMTKRMNEKLKTYKAILQEKDEDR